MMTIRDFYDIAEYANQNWKGGFSAEEVDQFAEEYYQSYLDARKYGVIERDSALDGLIVGLVEDWQNAYDGSQLGDWLETLAYDLGFRDFEELIKEFS